MDTELTETEAMCESYKQIDNSLSKHFLWAAVYLVESISGASLPECSSEFWPHPSTSENYRLSIAVFIFFNYSITDIN